MQLWCLITFYIQVGPGTNKGNLSMKFIEQLTWFIHIVNIVIARCTSTPDMAEQTVVVAELSHSCAEALIDQLPCHFGPSI